MQVTSNKVSVIGLGAMGYKLAQLLLQNGYQVTVWNRTSKKGEPLKKEGAIIATSAEDAVKASPIVVVCVYDYHASNSIFHTREVSAAVKGKVLVQLTTGSPQEAKDSESWADLNGAKYIDGAIQAAPSQMGRPDTPIFVSGAKNAFQESEQVLKVLAGGTSYLGEPIGAASSMDLATLSYIYGSLLGFFHGARIAEVSGIPVDTYGELVSGISTTFGDFLKFESKAIHKNDFTITESPLRISVEATARIFQHANESKINAEFPAFATGLFKRASEAGYSNEEVAAMIKVLRA